jgi:hypothetical protein
MFPRFVHTLTSWKLPSKVDSSHLALTLIPSAPSLTAIGPLFWKLTFPRISIHRHLRDDVFHRQRTHLCGRGHVRPLSSRAASDLAHLATAEQCCYDMGNYPLSLCRQALSTPFMGRPRRIQRHDARPHSDRHRPFRICSRCRIATSLYASPLEESCNLARAGVRMLLWNLPLLFTDQGTPLGKHCSMLIGWLVSAAFMYLLFPNLNYLHCMVVAAALSPTDPILAASVVGKGKFAQKVRTFCHDLRLPKQSD